MMSKESGVAVPGGEAEFQCVAIHVKRAQHVVGM